MSDHLSTKERLFFESRLDTSGDCWLWTGARATSGYGRIKVAGVEEMAHRSSYAHFNGPIPDGALVDHMCHNDDLSCAGGFSCLHRRCVNPDHLVLATGRENVLRGRGLTAQNATKTLCDAGHLLGGANLRVDPKTGYRRCRACARVVDRRRRAKRQEVDA